MKARISFVSDIFDKETKSITVYGQSKDALIDVAFALQKADDFVVTNIFISEDEVTENKES